MKRVGPASWFINMTLIIRLANPVPGQHTHEHAHESRDHNGDGERVQTTGEVRVVAPQEGNSIATSFANPIPYCRRAPGCDVPHCHVWARAEPGTTPAWVT